MDQAAHNKIVQFRWGIADDVLEPSRRDVVPIEKTTVELRDGLAKEHRLSDPLNTGEMVLYQTGDGQTRVQVRLSAGSVWLSLNQLADLFQRDKSAISKHIRKIFAEGELDLARTVAKGATVQNEGSRRVNRDIEFYRLEVILAAGYRVNSARGTQFRQW